MAERLRWTLEAAENLEEICSYIEERNPRAAKSTAKKLYALANSIPDSPLLGRVVPEYGFPDLRERILAPYRMVYRIKDGVIEILAIHHSSKQFPAVDELLGP